MGRSHVKSAWGSDNDQALHSFSKYIADIGIKMSLKLADITCECPQRRRRSHSRRFSEYTRPGKVVAPHYIM